MSWKDDAQDAIAQGDLVAVGEVPEDVLATHATLLELHRSGAVTFIFDGKIYRKRDVVAADESHDKSR